MTVSGTYGTTVFTVDDVIRRACLKLRIPTAAITSELAQTALEDLYLFMQTVVRMGVPLWTVEKVIVPLYDGQFTYDLPTRIVDKLGDPVRRKVSRADDYTQAISSAGGTLAYAFDGELTNVFVQSAPLGNVSYDFGTGYSVSTLGYLPAGTDATLTLIGEYSDDGATWHTAVPEFLAEAVAGEWIMKDCEQVAPHQYWRIRATAGTLNCYQLLFAFNPSEIMMGALNRDDYLNLPNKNFAGDPLSYWWNRQRDAPQVVLWPVPNQNFMAVVFNARRELMDVGKLTDTLDFPKRWVEAVVSNLAARLYQSGVKHGLDNPVDIQLLISDAQSSFKLAMGQEEDHMPVRFQPSIRRYTR